MPLGYLTRAVQLSASHRYHRPDWSDEENRRRFGSSAESHSHDYRCEVTVSGPIDTETGMVMDLGELDTILVDEVVGPVHGQHINSALEHFKPGAAIPTTENLAAYIVRKVGARLPIGVSLYRVRVQEDQDLWSDVYGSDLKG